MTFFSGSDFTVCKSMHPMSQLSTKFTDIPSLSKKKITKVSRLKSQWQRGSSSRCDQLICGWALPYKVKIPFEDINSISLRAVGTGWLWEAIAPLPYCVGNWPQRPILELLNILAGIQAKPSHSKGLGLIVAPRTTRIFKHSYGPAMVHSALPRNGDDVYHNETKDFTGSHLLC